MKTSPDQRVSPHAATIRLTLTALTAVALTGGVGCRSFLLALNEGKTEDVAAQCDKLRGQHVAIVVWADPSTLDVYPFAQSQTARQIQYMLEQNKKADELEDTTYVRIQEIADMQDQVGMNGPFMTNEDVGKRLKADVVVRIDLWDFTTRAPEANGLIKGRIAGNIAVQKTAQTEPLYRVDVSAEYPENSIGMGLDATDEGVLNQTLSIFGERVAQKFFKHKVKL